MRAIVIGAGVIGASISFRLAEAGADVVVLEANRIGGGTTGCTYAWINSHNGAVPIEYHTLRIASRALYPALQDRFGASWFHPMGYVEFGPSAEFATNVASLQARNHPVEWISPARLAELEPWIDPAAYADAAIAWYPDDAWLDPVAYAGDLLLAARSHGATIHTGARVTAMQNTAGRITGVRLADGVTMGADIVINAAGRWSPDIADDPGIKIPMASTLGLLVFTPPVATGVRRPVHAPGINIRPDGAGRLLAQSEELDITVDPLQPLTPTMPQAAEVLRRGTQLLPGLAGIQAEAVRTATRPIPADGLPAIGPVPRLDGYYLAVTHSGVTLSPIIGKLVAEELLTGRQSPLLTTFRPSRFFN